MHWRTRFLFNVSRVFLLPPLILRGALNILQINVPQYLSPILYLGSVAFYVNLYVRYWDWYSQREAKKRGARTIPIARGKWIGNIDLLLRIMQTPRKAYVGQRIHEIMLEHGTNTINIRPLWSDMIFTADEGVMKEMLATGFGVWEKGSKQRELMYSFFGHGIFNVDGKEWKQHRAMTRPYFIKERISDFEIFFKHALAVFEQLGRISASPIPVVDVQDILARFTLDSASEFLFGTDLDTIHGKLPIPGKAKLGAKGSATEDEFGGFVNAFEAAQIGVSFRNMRGMIWPLFELFQDKVAAHKKVINSYLDPLIMDAKAENLKREKAGLQVREDTTLLGELVKTIEDSEVVRNELLSILLAGRDTTAGLLTFTLYLLARHPDVAQKLREEIAIHCGMEPPSYATVKKMKYLRAVLDETLRLFPLVPLNTRICNQDCLLPTSSHVDNKDRRPYFVPANTQIFYSTLIMQRNPALWGPDSHSFNPSRWADPAAAASYHQNFQFIPFNAGPRICPGQNFGYNEASFFLCVLLPRFKFTLAPEYQPEGSRPLKEWKNVRSELGRVRDEELWPLSSMTMYVKGGLWMKVEKIAEGGEGIVN